VHLQSAWNKYGEDAFEFLIIQVVENKIELVKYEQYWMNKLQVNDRTIGYNSSPTAFSCLGVKHSDEVKLAASKRKLGIKQSEETKLKRSLSLKGRKLSEENKRKIGEANSIALKGKPLSEERRAKITIANQTRIRSPETLDKLRNLMLGNQHAKGQKQSLEMLAKRFSPEAKEKMRLGALRRWDKAKRNADVAAKRRA